MLLSLGHLSQHMAAHILAMNLLAPLLVFVWLKLRASIAAPGRTALVSSTLVQMLLLFGWHLPSVLLLALESIWVMTAMHLSLFFVACWFWHSVLGEDRVWRALTALLVNAKVYCLLGVLFVFAPRSIYASPGPAHEHVHATVSALADQQMAGLLMLVACPVIYIGTATFLVSRWLQLMQEKRVDWAPVSGVG